MAIPRFEGRPLEGAKLKYTDHRSENKVHNMNQVKDGNYKLITVTKN